MSETPADWLRREPFTLALSGGFFGFFAHTGVLLALEQADLVPARVVGVSAGALAGGLWSAGLPAAHIARELRRIRRPDFWDPGLPLGGLLKGQKFEAILSRQLEDSGVDRIEACRLPFAPIVHDLRTRTPRALETGPLARAIRASCSVPFLFRPVRWEGTLLVDGGVSDRSGLGFVASTERVLYHHLLSKRRRDDPRHPPGHDRPNTQLLALPNLPRVNPYKLPKGPLALAEAHARASHWLSTVS